MFSQDRTNKKPARTDTFAESLQLLRRRQRRQAPGVLAHSAPTRWPPGCEPARPLAR